MFDEYYNFLGMVWESIKAIYEYLINLVFQVVAFANEAIMVIPKMLFFELMTGAGSLLQHIPQPEFMAKIEGLDLALPCQLLYFLHPLALDWGLSLILGAASAAFLLRRIPIIG
jgi:hypothetical protein